jgi:sugar transferase (PEP-CTERM system associated)
VITETGLAPEEANDAVIDESLRKMMKSIQIEIPKDQPTPVDVEQTFIEEVAQPELGVFPEPTRVFQRPLRFKKRLLILGTGQLARDLSQALEFQRRFLVDVVGFLDSKGEEMRDCARNHAILGTYDQLIQVVEERHIDTVVVCTEDRRATLPVQTLLDLKAMGLTIIDGHYLFEEASGRLSIDSLKPSTLIFSTGFRRRTTSLVAKRLFDIIISVMGLLVLSPLFLFIAALIKVDSDGPVFYRQVRVGFRGRPYLIWKFRSMREDAENHGPRWAQANDPRISRVGWWLRKMRLDELPQLMNVLQGEMSLVGPRPERPVFVQDLRIIIPYYDIRHTVRPGITGWAQVNYRYAASQVEAHTKLQYDLYYVKNLSLLLDFKVLVRTLKVVVLGEGAQ